VIYLYIYIYIIPAGSYNNVFVCSRFKWYDLYIYNIYMYTHACIYFIIVLLLQYYIIWGRCCAARRYIDKIPSAIYAKFNLPHRPATAALSVYHSPTLAHTRTHTLTRHYARRFRAVTPDKQTINLLGEKDENARVVCVLYNIVMRQAYITCILYVDENFSEETPFVFLYYYT